ncbi:MAG TPA: hypothetical protein VMS17_00645 [Gemmataceae bacterium]|nr:hypothetical protein [Gemmataceae bacterium]
MTRTRGLAAAALLAMVGASGCLETAHYVSLDANGGVVGIPGPVDQWPTHNRQAAEALMRQKCPQGYVIDHEQEVAIGQTTTQNAAGNNASLSSVVFGVGAESRTMETRPINEWQITFHALPVEAPGPGPTPSTPQAQAVQSLPTVTNSANPAPQP